MATATTSTFAKFKILIGDGVTPTEGFTAICGLTSKGVQYNSDVVTTEVPDCADEDLPSWMEKDVKAIGISISGSGVWSREDHGRMVDWFMSGAKKNVRIEYADANTGDPRTMTGPAVLASMNNAVEKGARISSEITIEFARKPTIVDAA